MQELKTFCTKTINLLDKQEQSTVGNKSTLKHAVRLDISVMRKENGSYSYFVNEVMRNVDMFMFLTPRDNLDIIKKVGQITFNALLNLVHLAPCKTRKRK